MRTSKVFFSFNCWCQPKFSSAFDPLIKFHFEVNDWSSLTCILAIRAKKSEETQHASGCFMSAEKEGGSKTDPLACGRLFTWVTLVRRFQRGYMALLNHGTSTLLVTTRSTPCYTCTCNISETCRGEVSREMLSYLVYQWLWPAFWGLSSVISSMSKVILR